MRFSDIARRGQQFLRSEQGRSVGRQVADRAAGVARGVAPKYAGKIDQANRAAQDYLNRQGPQGPGTGDTYPGTTR